MRDDVRVGRHRAPLTWRGQLTGVLLGAAGGVSVNRLSDVYGYRAVGALVALAAVVGAASWLRQLPPRAVLVRYSTSVLLGLAMIAAVLLVAVPRPWAAFVSFLVTLLVVAAVLIPNDLAVAGRFLTGAACTGLGVACVALAMAPDSGRTALFRGLFVVAGLMMLALGAATLRGVPHIRTIAYICAGVVLVVVGLLIDVVAIVVEKKLENLLAGVLLSILGAAYVGLGIGIARRHDVTRGIAYLAIGTTLAGITVATSAYHDVLSGVMFLSLSLTPLILGVATLRKSRFLHGVAYLALGATLIGFGVTRLHNDLRHGNYLPLLALAGLGLAVTGFGAATLHASGTLGSVRAWLMRLIQEPS